MGSISSVAPETSSFSNERREGSIYDLQRVKFILNRLIPRKVGAVECECDQRSESVNDGGRGEGLGGLRGVPTVFSYLVEGSSW